MKASEGAAPDGESNASGRAWWQRARSDSGDHACDGQRSPEVQGRLAKWRGHASCIPGLYGVEAMWHGFLRRHAHEDFSFTLVTTGGLVSRARGRSVDAGAGDLLLANPLELRDCGPRHGALARSLTLHVGAALVSECLGKQAREVVAPVFAHAASASMLDSLFACMGESNPSSTRELLCKFLSATLREASASRPTPHVLEKARALIDAAPAAKHSLDALAEAAGMSRWHFVRAFGRYAGLSPHAYIMQKRIEHARALMRNGAGLAQAATLSGFADQSHMTRVFRGKYGLTPRSWASLVCPSLRE